MPVLTTRTEFRQLADLRLSEARTLLDNKLWDGVYYLAGYAVECAIKVVIIGRLHASDSYPNRPTVEVFFKHDLTALLRLAELENDLTASQDASTQDAWTVTKDSSEQARYQTNRDESKAVEFYGAAEKVVKWLKTHW